MSRETAKLKLELEIYKDALKVIHANAEDNFACETAMAALNQGYKLKDEF